MFNYQVTFLYGGNEHSLVFQSSANPEGTPDEIFKGIANEAVAKWIQDNGRVAGAFPTRIILSVFDSNRRVGAWDNFRE